MLKLTEYIKPFISKLSGKIEIKKCIFSNQGNVEHQEYKAVSDVRYKRRI